MAVEKIGGVNLSTYKLKLAEFQDNIQLPSFKRIVDVHKMEDDVKFLEAQKVKVKLIGIYDSRSDLGSNLDNFESKIRSALKQEWEFGAHSFKKDCVVADGTTTQIFGIGLEITLTLIVIEDD